MLIELRKKDMMIICLELIPHPRSGDFLFALNIYTDQYYGRLDF